MWDEVFSAPEYVYGEVPNEFIRHAFSDFRGSGVQQFFSVPTPAVDGPAENTVKKVGCFAEGEGRNANFLAGLGFEVTAFDQSTVGLKKAEKLAAKNGRKIDTKICDILQDAESIPRGEFDAAINVFGHVAGEENQIKFFENIMQSIKVGGYLIFEVYSDRQLPYKSGGPPTIDLLYAPETLLKIFKKHHIVHFFCGEVTRHEGDRHCGLSHVINGVIQIK